jgi:hypothetical protein
LQAGADITKATASGLAETASTSERPLVHAC